MADKLFPFVIDAPATLNRSKSYAIPLDKAQGKSFRINRLFIEIPELDAAIAAEDTVGLELSTTEQNEKTALLTAGSNNTLIMKESLNFHLALIAITSLVDLKLGLVELQNFRGIFLDCSVKNYLTHLVTGQDGGIPVNIVIEGGYTSKTKDDWHYNTF